MSRELLNYPLYPGDMVTYSCDSTMRIGIIKKAIPYTLVGRPQEYKLSIEFIWGASTAPVGDITSKLQLVPYKTVVKLRPEEVLPKLDHRVSAKFVELMDKYKAV